MQAIARSGEEEGKGEKKDTNEAKKYSIIRHKKNRESSGIYSKPEEVSSARGSGEKEGRDSWTGCGEGSAPQLIGVEAHLYQSVNSYKK